MIAVDTNILVYAHREDAPWHEAAYDALRDLAEGKATWCIPAPCVHEFCAVVTHPRIYRPPTPMDLVWEQVGAWFESPSLVIIAETEGYWARLESLLLASRVAGGQIHDARIAALCLHHGVTTLWSADRDFGRFPELSVQNPLVRGHLSEG